MTERPDSYDGPATIDRTRYRTITTFFARVILHIVLWDLVLKRIAPGRVLESRPVRWRNISRRFRLLAIEMGGVLIKLGQFLSARVDILPPEITEELQGLQDEVPPVAAEEILAVLEKELDNLPGRFMEIERRPLAAASLGQVHRAWLRQRQPGSNEGVPVVIKVQRPGIVQTVQTDLAALRVVARLVKLYPPIGRRADVPALMDEFARTLWLELDYKAEAEHGARFAEMFAGDPKVYIPYFYRRHCTGRVLVLEYVGGFKITDVEGITAAGIDPKKVAIELLDTYFLQFFVEGFFHADPHPGNLFVLPRNDLSWDGTMGTRPFSLAFVDFGMVGQLDNSLKDNLRRWMIAVLQKDARSLTEVYRDMGFFLPGADLDRITDAQRVLLDHLWGRNLMDLAQLDARELEALSREFRDILFDFPFQVPQDFIYLGRALGILSGLASMLDPTINLWYHLERYGRELISRDDVQKAGWQLVLDWVRPLVGLPGRLDRTLTALEAGTLRVQTVPDNETRRRMQRLEKQVGRLQWAVLGAAGLLSATLLYIFRRDKD